jgi:hypothetical protein
VAKNKQRTFVFQVDEGRRTALTAQSYCERGLGTALGIQDVHKSRIR